MDFVPIKDNFNLYDADYIKERFEQLIKYMVFPIDGRCVAVGDYGDCVQEWRYRSHC